MVLLLRLERSRRAAVDEQQVVRATVTGRHRELAHRHAEAGAEVHVVLVLDVPAGAGQSRVDLPASSLLGRQGAHEDRTSPGSALKSPGLPKFLGPRVVRLSTRWLKQRMECLLRIHEVYPADSFSAKRSSPPDDQLIAA